MCGILLEGPGEGIGTDQGTKKVQALQSSANTSTLNSIRIILSTGAQLFQLILINPSMILAWANEQFPKILRDTV